MVGWEPFLYNWSANQQITKGLATETIDIAEQRGRAKTVSRITSTENIFVSEGILNRIKANIREITETLSHPSAIAGSFSDSFTVESFGLQSEDLQRLKTIVRTIIDEPTIIVSESLGRRKNIALAISIEIGEPAVLVSETRQRVTNKTRLLYDSGTPPESYSDISFTATSYWTVTREIADTVTGHKTVTLGKSITETIDIAEAVNRITTAAATIAAQTVAISDSNNTIRNKLRDILEDLIESSDLADQEIASSGISIPLVESEDITEDLLLELAKTRILEDTTAITDLLQGWVNNAPMQIEEHPEPPASLISAVRERYIRAQERKPPRFEYAIENTVKAPLLVPARLDTNKVIAPIKPVIVPLSTLQSGLRLGFPDRVTARTAIITRSQPNTLRLPLRHQTQWQGLKTNLRLDSQIAPQHQAIEPRKIINIERRYRTLKAYLLLHMIETLD